MSVHHFHRVCTHLLEDLGSHYVAAVEDNAKLSAPFHLFEQRSGVRGVQRELSDLQPDVIPGWSHN